MIKLEQENQDPDPRGVKKMIKLDQESQFLMFGAGKLRSELMWS